jgi:hypothetical protein
MVVEYLVRHLHLVAFYVITIFLEIVLLSAATGVNASFRVVGWLLFAGLANMAAAMYCGRMPGLMLGNHLADLATERRTGVRPSTDEAYHSHDPWLGNLVMSVPPLIAGYLLLWGGPYALNLACYRHNEFIEAMIPCGDKSYYGWRIPFGAIAMGIFLYFLLMSLTIVPSSVKQSLAIVAAVAAILLVILIKHDAAVDSPVVTTKDGPVVTGTRSGG